MYGNNSRKITCDYYIDDKAVLPAMVNALELTDEGELFYIPTESSLYLFCTKLHKLGIFNILSLDFT